MSAAEHLPGDEWADEVQQPSDASMDKAPAPREFTNVYDWYESWFRPIYQRTWQDRGPTWCAQWWRHAEAVARLQAIWLAWEELRGEPTGMSVWWRDHADPHMGQLTHPDGCFKGCSPPRPDAGDGGRHAPRNAPVPHADDPVLEILRDSANDGA